MAKQIDSVGTYRGTVSEISFGETKNGYPQAVLRLLATEKYLETAEEMKAFNITEPGYGAWDYDESMIGFFVMFKSKDVYNNETKLLNYDQLKTALNWDGRSFEPFGDDSFLNKTVLFRVEQREYEGKSSLQITWIDNENASPVRSLKAIDLAQLKALSNKLQFGAPAPTAAKPTAAKPRTTKTTTGNVAGKTANPTVATPVVATVIPSATNATPPARKPAAAKNEPQPCSKTAAWLDVSDPDKNGNSDANAVEQAWNDTITAVAGEVPDEEITMEQWGAIRIQAVAKLLPPK